jgi:hypothetical protein
MLSRDQTMDILLLHKQVSRCDESLVTPVTVAIRCAGPCARAHPSSLQSFCPSGRSAASCGKRLGVDLIDQTGQSGLVGLITAARICLRLVALIAIAASLRALVSFCSAASRMAARSAASRALASASSFSTRSCSSRAVRLFSTTAARRSWMSCVVAAIQWKSAKEANEKQHEMLKQVHKALGARPIKKAVQ